MSDEANCTPFGQSPISAAVYGDQAELPPVTGFLRTRCCECGKKFYIRPSLSMQLGHNSGHCTCTKCKTFLHVELLEGDEAWTEEWDRWLKRTSEVQP